MTLDAHAPNSFLALIEEAWRRARRRQLFWALFTLSVLAVALGVYLGSSGEGKNGGSSPPSGQVGNAQHYADAAGRWSISYPLSTYLEHSSTPEPIPSHAIGGIVQPLYSEVTVASFRPRKGIESGQSANTAWVHFRPPSNKWGQFPSAGVAFRLSRVSYGRPYDTPSPIRETHFPLSLERFAHSGGRQIFAPRPRSFRVYADGESFNAQAWIGRKTSPALTLALERIIRSLRFAHLWRSEHGVLGLSDRHRLGAVVPMSKVAPGVYINLYVVHAPGGFYAVRRRWLTDYHHKRIGCQVTFDRISDGFSCSRLRIRWNRFGEVISRPAGMEHVGEVRFERVTIGWDGHLLLTGAALGAQGVRALW